MSAVALVVVGVVLCLAGAWSVRVAVLAAGFGTSWLLAEALDAATTTAVIVSCAGALAVFLVSLFVTKLLSFVGGCVVGAVIGAKVFVLVEGGDEDGAEWLLALVFVPAVAVVCGLLAQHFQHRFLMWGTALAGSALILSGLGRAGSDQTELFWRPETPTGSAVFAALWLVLTVAGHQVQALRPRRHGVERSGRAGQASS